MLIRHGLLHFFDTDIDNDLDLNDYAGLQNGFGVQQNRWSGKLKSG